MLVSWFAFAALVVHAQRTRTKSRRAWSLLAFTAVCNIVLLASARANVVGPDIAREYRYQTESGGPVRPRRRAGVPAAGRGPRGERRAPGRVRRVRRFRGRRTAGSPRLVARSRRRRGGGDVSPSVRYVDLWQDRNPSEAYFANVRRTLAAAPDKPVPLADSGIPQTLLWAYRYPENAYSHVFRNLRPTRRRTRARRWTGSTSSTTRAGSPPSPSRRPGVHQGGSGCGFPLTGKQTTTIPLDGPVIGGGWWLQVSYASPEAVTCTCRPVTRGTT